MFQPIDSFPKEPRTRLTGWIALAVVLLGAPALSAEAPFDIADETAEALQAELDGRFEIIQLSRGYVVQPTSTEVDYELIEIEENGVLVDGKAFDLDELKELLGEDAEILFALAGDQETLESFEDLERRIKERQAAEALQLEDNIRRQVEELQQLDSERAAELSEDLERRRQRDESRKRMRTDDRVSLGSPLTVKENESARDAVVIFGPLTVRGEVRGDSVVVLGNADITGRLDGSLTVVGGKIFLGPESVVNGDVNSIGGTVHRAEGSQVEGQVFDMEGPFAVDVPGVEFEGWDPLSSLHVNRQGWRGLKFAGTLFNTIFLAFLVAITTLVARRRVGSVAHRARQQPWKSGLVGAMVQVLTVPVLVLVSLILLVSIVGIPVLMVLLPLSVLVFALVCILGYAGVAAVLGRALLRLRETPYSWASFLTVMLGLVLIQSWQIVGAGLAFADGWIRFTGILLITFGFFLKYLAWTVGLGAVMLDRFSPLPAAVAYESVSASPGRPPSFSSSPFESPRSESPSPPPPPAASPPPPLPWEEEDDPDEDREYRDAGEVKT